MGGQALRFFLQDLSGYVIQGLIGKYIGICRHCTDVRCSELGGVWFAGPGGLAV